MRLVCDGPIEMFAERVRVDNQNQLARAFAFKLLQEEVRDNLETLISRMDKIKYFLNGIKFGFIKGFKR